MIIELAILAMMNPHQAYRIPPEIQGRLVTPKQREGGAIKSRSRPKVMNWFLRRNKKPQWPEGLTTDEHRCRGPW
jgi:hypothetical protein